MSLVRRSRRVRGNHRCLVISIRVGTSNVGRKLGCNVNSSTILPIYNSLPNTSITTIPPIL